MHASQGPPPADRTPFRPDQGRRRVPDGAASSPRGAARVVPVATVATVVAWWAAGVSALTSLVLAAPGASGRVHTLTRSLAVRQGGHTEATLTRAAQVTVGACLGWLVVVGLVCVLLAWPARTRRRVRRVLVVVAFVDVVVLVVVVSALAPPGWTALVRWALLAHGALTVLALLTLLHVRSRVARRNPRFGASGD